MLLFWVRYIVMIYNTDSNYYDYSINFDSIFNFNGSIKLIFMVAFNVRPVWVFNMTEIPGDCGSFGV